MQEEQEMEKGEANQTDVDDTGSDGAAEDLNVEEMFTDRDKEVGYRQCS